MAQIQLDEISVDELFALKKEIDSFVHSQNATERAYCEGSSEYGELLVVHQLNFDKRARFWRE